MPKRKRQAAASGGGDGSGDAVASSSSDTGGLHWQWEADGGVWESYTRPHQLSLTTAARQNKKDVSLSVSGGTQLKVVFDRGVQKTVSTGWERRVRCAVQDSTNQDDWYVWEWEDERGRWMPYTSATSLSLEEAHQSSSPDAVEFTACRRSYSVDITKMKQTNTDTNVVRNVRRQKTDLPKVEDGDDSKPEVTTSRSRSSRKPARDGVSEGASNSASAATSKGSGGRRAKSGKSATADDPEEKKVKTVLVKGPAPVDSECKAKLGKAHVYWHGKDIYDTMLNQTNIGNNNNKFYLIQLLEDDARKSYSVWLRWGRVGNRGQTNLVECGPDLDEAKEVFCAKFRDKTRNDWSARNKFTKVSGKYDMVHLDYKPEEPSKPLKTEPDAVIPESKLASSVQDLVNLICDVRSMEAAVVEMKFDAKRAPLGKLTASQIKAGYAALKVIDSCVDKAEFGQKLTDACSDFYTRIPHDFGMQRPPIIRTKADVKAKLQLLEALADIEVAMKIIAERKSNENPVDTHYKSLGCTLTPLTRSNPDFKMLEDYMINTHAPTHNQYSLQLLDAFSLTKQGEDSNFTDYGNRQLLWHGSRLTNWVGILSQGLRIAPPEAPVTGYMFGKGVYFADMSSKSANYCFATKTNNVGLVLLCEVSLGQCKELLAADYTADKLKPPYHSVKGMGKIAPSAKTTFTMKDGTVVPLGKPHDTSVNNPHGYTLNYNEYIVYNTNQLRMRYLLKVKFCFV